MAPQSLNFRRIRRRVRRTLNYGDRTTKWLHLPLSEFVVNYFDKNMPFDYMTPETSTNISRRGFADPCTLVVAMVYLDRLRERNREFFESSSPVDLYLPALVLASKYLHDSDVDERVANCSWAEAAEMEDEYLNHLEWDFVGKMDWDCLVKSETFERYLNELEKYVSSDFIKKNGFGTYNELTILSDGIKSESCWEILHNLISSIGLLSLFYSVTVASMITTPLVYQSLSSAQLPGTSNGTSNFGDDLSSSIMFSKKNELDDGLNNIDENKKNAAKEILTVGESLLNILFISRGANDVPAPCYDSENDIVSEFSDPHYRSSSYIMENTFELDALSNFDYRDPFNMTNHFWGALEMVC